jgi:hypothetical protein
MRLAIANLQSPNFFSPAIGDWLARELGYPIAFMIPGCFAIGSTVICGSPASQREFKNRIG